MKNRTNRRAFLSKVFIFACMAIFTSSLFAERDEQGRTMSGAYLQWMEVDGATGYIVEIVSEKNRPVVTRKVSSSTIRVPLPVGEYSFRVGAVNKFDKVGSWSDWAPLVILESPNPKFDRISPEKTRKGDLPNEILVTGKNIMRGALVKLWQKNISLEARNVEYISDSKISFTVDVENARSGAYDLEIVNPGGSRVKTGDVFIIEENRSDAEPAMALASPLDISVGYLATIPVARWGTIFESSISGIHVTMDSGLGNVPVLRDIPFIHVTGAMLEASYTSFKGKERPEKVLTGMNMTLLGGRLYYQVVIFQPVVFKISAGGGIAMSSFNEEGRYSGSRTYTSRDEYLVSGVSLRAPLTSSFFVEGGVDYMMVRYVDVEFQSVRFLVNGGIRL